ncbi:MAG: beta-ketoacyl synthase N-terminal-like domain-containing protein [Rhizonema sp. NSF051]|nr:beta-ketoacyl synthase N-terminal-like domain-containing protein [Rhizonema sp. NSF051]
MNDLHSPNSVSQSEIAIIGMSGRFPGSPDLNTFWQNLCSGVESISFFDQGELESSSIDHTVFNNPNYVRARAILEGVELFDASFFGFSAREAEIMDPQHRLFLECAQEALESAGYDTETYKGAIAIYAGTKMSTYFLFNIYSNPDLLESVGSFQAVLGNDKDYLPTSTSYKLNLTGPSVNVQTACSTSLVAVHQASQSLLSGECDIALAGGVSVMVPQKVGYLYQEGGIGSPDGHCRAFDAKALGTVGGNGVGIVVLKRLVNALADGDCIHAIIKGSAINNDGSVKVGYTAPSVDGQAAVISEAQAIAAIEPETVTYIEAHGTGTALGDPIEIAALTEAFRTRTEAKSFCAIGSLKTNVGHLDVASGVAGLIKTVLALKHKLLPPSLHFEQPNPKIDFTSSPFYVNTSLSEWKTNGNPRRAGVSSFGIGGTNAHVVVEEAPTVEVSGKSRSKQLLVLSAKTDSALDTATKNLVEHLKQHPDLNLADVAYTYHIGRTAFKHRRMVVCQNLEDTANDLLTLDAKQVFTNFPESGEPPVVFMFSGQGTQYVNMGKELYESEPTFREQVNFCSELLKSHLGLDLHSMLYPTEEQTEAALQQLQQTAMTQPALFVIEYALAQLWLEWGVRPQAMLGHSIGEYVAACLSGVFSLEDALALVAARGQLMQKLPGGNMLVVPLEELELQSLLGDQLSLATINGPSLCVVSGATDAVEQLEDQLAKRGINCRRLHTSHAFHSEMMNPVLEPFTVAVKKATLNPPQIPFVSNVTGTWITAAEATDPSYWTKHLRQTVRFADGLHELFKQPERILLEVGPGRTLSTLAQQHPDKPADQIVLNSLRHPHEQRSDVEFLLTTLGKLWLSGIQVDWSGFYVHERRHRLPLPTYPFERQRYWIESQKQSENGSGSSVSLDKKSDIADWFYLPFWKQSVPPALLGHGDLAKRKSCWLVFVDECGLGDQIVKRLKQEGQDVSTVVVGEQFIKHQDNLYTINPQHCDDYDALLKELRTLGKTPKTIVHLWSVTSNIHTESEIEFFKKSQYLGFYSLLFLTQAIGKQNLTEPLQIEVVSNNMQEVAGEETLFPEKATVLGPCKVIPQEYPYITCKSIDIVISNSETWDDQKLVHYIVSELAAKSSETIVAYRGSHRWVQTFEPVRLEESVEETPRLRNKGVYLITGGLGGIGLVLAEYLAQSVQARLILIGRSAFPGRDEWEKWLATHDPQDEVSCKIRKLQQIQKLGAEVLVKSADVANLEQMRSVMTQGYEYFGEIHGVIHAAGIAGGGIIQLKTPEMAESVFVPKVRGTQVLDFIFKNVKLDFFVLCSSLNSILGGFGQVDYCAANCFLDAFARCNTFRNGTFTVSINWDAWQEVGMGVNTAVLLDLKGSGEHSLNKGILSKEGTDAFSRITYNSLAQVVVSTQEFQTKIEQNNAVAVSTALEKLVQTRLSNSKHPRPNLHNAYAVPRNETEQRIALIWQELFGLEQVGIYDNFFELGGNSLLAIQILSRLRDVFQVQINLHSFFEAQTLADLAVVIEQLHAQQEEEKKMHILMRLQHLSEEEVDAEIQKRILGLKELGGDDE